MNTRIPVEAGVSVVDDHQAATWQCVNSSLASDSFLAKTKSALERQRFTCLSPAESSNAVLKDILKQSEETYFGKKHGLAKVRSLQDWKKATPVRCYPAFQSYIDKLLDGDVNVLTRSEPYAFLKTSGSSGNPKLVPTTRHWRNAYRGRALYAQWGLYFESIGFDKARNTAVLDLSWERSSTSVRVGDYPSYGISQRPAAVSSIDWLPPWYDESWFRGVDGENYKSGLYRKLRLLAGADVRIIVALNPSKVVGLAETLGERGGDLIADLRNGTLDGRPCYGGRNRELATQLDAVRRNNRGVLRLIDLWPDLSLVVSWNSASAALYRPWLEAVTPGILKLPFSATGTEGIITIPVDRHSSAGPLAVDLGLYEFVPVDNQDDEADLEPDVATLDYHEVEIGKTYNVVMSQANGLYRYDVGDRYTVVDRVGGVPRLEFVGRTGFGSSFTGEKLTEEDIYNAVRLALGKEWRTRPMFSCIPVWATPPGYTLVIEWSEVHSLPVNQFADQVEIELQKLNIEYAEKRRTDRLTRITVVRVKPGTFGMIEEWRRLEGAPPAQLKHHWIQRSDDFLRYLTYATMEPHA
jgi:hypothetical protein